MADAEYEEVRGQAIEAQLREIDQHNQRIAEIKNALVLAGHKATDVRVAAAYTWHEMPCRLKRLDGVLRCVCGEELPSENQ